MLLKAQLDLILANSIDSGAIGVLVKEGEVLKKEGVVIKSNSLFL